MKSRKSLDHHHHHHHQSLPHSRPALVNPHFKEPQKIAAVIVVVVVVAAAVVVVGELMNQMGLGAIK